MQDKKVIITISRQYGSGGREVGRKIADELGIAYYDSELIALAVKESGIAEDFFGEESEQVTNPFSYLFSFSNVSNGQTDTLPVSDRIFLAQAKVIKDVADKSSCVVVGHCADYILGEYENVMNFFIHADTEARVERVMERNNLTAEEALAKIKKFDKCRAGYYQHYTDKKWGRAENYGMSISSSELGLDGTTQVILKYLEIKGC